MQLCAHLPRLEHPMAVRVVLVETVGHLVALLHPLGSELVDVGQARLPIRHTGRRRPNATRKHILQEEPRVAADLGETKVDSVGGLRDCGYARWGESTE